MTFHISDIAVEVCKLRGIVLVISSIPCRRVFRLHGYDYSSEGLYFVTICADRRAALFGKILDRKMIMNEFGRIVDEMWRGMFPFVDDSDSSIVMPNHLHGIIAITNIAAGGSRTAPTRKSLGRLVGAFKTLSTRRINEIRGTPGAVIWQRNFYEHIVRNQKSLERIVTYIQDNPSRWESDPENPSGPKPSQGCRDFGTPMR